MNEMAKATKRRIKSDDYKQTWFVGIGLDIGCGHDLLSKDIFTNITNISGYDFVLGHENAQTLPKIFDNSFDFVVSSHCLEHLHDPKEALNNWIRIVKPNGYLIVTIPDYELYERCQWPSKFNHDHKWAWTLNNQIDDVHVIHIDKFLNKFENKCKILSVNCYDEHFDPRLAKSIDQSLGECECAIEFILRKN